GAGILARFQFGLLGTDIILHFLNLAHHGLRVGAAVSFGKSGFHKESPFCFSLYSGKAESHFSSICTSTPRLCIWRSVPSTEPVGVPLSSCFGGWYGPIKQLRWVTS